MATSTQDWIEELKSISVLELSERIKALEEEFGVSATAVAAAAPPGAGGGGAADDGAAEEQTAFDVVLTGAGDKKIQVIKVVRAATGLVTSLNGLIGGLARQLSQIAEQGLVGGSAPAAEAPAAEAEAPAAEPEAEAEAPAEASADESAAEEAPAEEPSTENQED